MSASAQALSNSEILRRLFRFAWQYRRDCLAVLSYQGVLLALGLAGLGAVGLAVDTIRHAVDPAAATPRWPFGWQPPPGVGPMTLTVGLALLVLFMAGLRALLNYRYSIAVGRLLQLDIVPRLRSQVFDKLQRLDFRFFDGNASGSIINRVTGDVQSLRSFIDGVLIQSVILLLSLGGVPRLHAGQTRPAHPGLSGVHAPALDRHRSLLPLGAAGLRREPAPGRRAGAGAVRGRAGDRGGARLRRRAPRARALCRAQSGAARSAAAHLPAGEPVFAGREPGGPAQPGGAAVLRRAGRTRRRAVAR